MGIPAEHRRADMACKSTYRLFAYGGLFGQSRNQGVSQIMPAASYPSVRAHALPRGFPSAHRVVEINVVKGRAPAFFRETYRMAREHIRVRSSFWKTIEPICKR